MGRKILGERIKKARLQKNLTQIELAKKIGVEQPAINRYESGKRSNRVDMENIIKIAEVLDVSLDYLFGLKEKNDQ